MKKTIVTALAVLTLLSCKNETEKTAENSKTEIKSIKTEPNFSKTILKSETKLLAQTQKKSKTKVENPTLKTQENAVAEIQPNNPKETIASNENTIPENIDSLLASAETNSKSSSKNSSVKINSTNLLRDSIACVSSIHFSLFTKLISYHAYPPYTISCNARTLTICAFCGKSCANENKSSSLLP